MDFPRNIKHEAELSKEFAQEVVKTPGGEKLLNCIQCGTCSGICPLSVYMDYRPRKIMAMVREGFKEEVLSSKTIWLCASCYECAIECPQGIKITDIMYTLKRMAIQQKKYPKNLSSPELAKSFYSMVKEDGRNTESWLVVILWLKTSIIKFFTNAWLGIRLVLKGRISFKRDKIKQKDQLKKLLKEVEDEH